MISRIGFLCVILLFFFGQANADISGGDANSSPLDNETNEKLKAFSSISSTYLSALWVTGTCGNRAGLQTESEQTTKTYMHENFRIIESVKKEMQQYLTQRIGQENYSKIRFMLEDTYIRNLITVRPEIQHLVSSDETCKTFMSNLRRGFGDIDIGQKTQMEIILGHKELKESTHPVQKLTTSTDTSVTSNAKRHAVSRIAKEKIFNACYGDSSREQMDKAAGTCLYDEARNSRDFKMSLTANEREEIALAATGNSRALDYDPNYRPYNTENVYVTDITAERRERERIKREEENSLSGKFKKIFNLN